MRDALVLTDRTAKDDTLVGIRRRPRDRREPQAHRLRRDQYALRIHAVQDDLETLALGPDAILDGNGGPVELHDVGLDRMPAYSGDRPTLYARAN